MSEHFTPISFERLASWIFTEYKENRTIFGIPEKLFFRPEKEENIHSSKYGKLLETPFGVAAGPHTQLSQNIIIAWLMGARFIELKTVQTLDEIEVLKPCIDIEDEGYNCEWSQELKLDQAYNEYLNAWVIIHMLRKLFEHDNGTNQNGFIFNMSVGYDLKGIKNENVQRFLKKMRDAKDDISSLKKVASKYFEKAEDIRISPEISDNITLSTMHGCPPAEISKIASYLISELDFHTTIKFNPTLLGKDAIHDILNKRLGYRTHVPDVAFEHDPQYKDALDIISKVSKVSEECGKDFSFKLSNTLESVNNRDVFLKEADMMYMSGRALHPIDINLAKRLMDDLKSKHSVSFSAGADAFNVIDIISCNIKPITVCSDILKPGGYTRIVQYVKNLRDSFERFTAKDYKEFIVVSYCDRFFNREELLKECVNIEKKEIIADILEKNLESCADLIRKELEESSLGFDTIYKECSRLYVKHYSEEVLAGPLYRKDYRSSLDTKTERDLNMFDCISAPCTYECPVDQKVPEYIYHISKGNLQEASRIITEDNPLPEIASRVCDHKCQSRCVRNNYDQPLNIRALKRFVMDNTAVSPVKFESDAGKVAIIGAGPSGFACAYFLAKSGMKPVIFEKRPGPGGMAHYAIPEFRLPGEIIIGDFKRLEALGVEFRFNTEIGKDVSINDLLTGDYLAVFIGAGAQNGINLDVPGSDSEGVFDALEYLYMIRHSNVPEGKKVAVIGGGNSACDVARSAWRLKDVSEVTLLYRRTRNEMPADPEEISQLEEEGIKIIELVSPVEIKSQGNRVKSIVCIKNELGEPDSSGRRRPVPVEGSHFELEVDTIVPAISQKTELGFLKDLDLKLTRWNTIEVDEFMKTSMEAVYAGGDVVRGPYTLIKAAGDGKKAALSIMGNIDEVINKGKIFTKEELIEKRAFKEEAVAPHMRSAKNRKDFKEFEETYSKDEAMKEALRCLRCDEMCSICVSVCPNRANHTYQSEPYCWDVPVIEVLGDQVKVRESREFKVMQEYQVFNIGDFCNECGNCNTFCPSSDAPYINKPKVYLEKESFEGHNEDCYQIKEKNGDLELRIRKNDKEYTLYFEDEKHILESDDIKLSIDRNFNYEIINNRVGDLKLDLNDIAPAIVLFNGIRQSMPYII